MDRRTKICIWVILIGLANFLAYAVLYLVVEGEAVRGHVEVVGGQTRYVLQSGHEVSRCVYLYSGLHSISIWLTVGAVMLAMLTLAKERIASSMRSTIVRGRTLITMLATIITMLVIVLTIVFIRDFCKSFHEPVHVAPTQPAATNHALDGR